MLTVTLPLDPSIEELGEREGIEWNNKAQKFPKTFHNSGMCTYSKFTFYTSESNTSYKENRTAVWFLYKILHDFEPQYTQEFKLLFCE